MYLQLLACMDAISAFKNLGMSLMPFEFVFMNLPPRFRTKVEYMMLSLLLPFTLKPQEQKKYFDYVIETDLNPMLTTGIRYSGDLVARALVFGSPLDLPGRDKFFQLRGWCSLVHFNNSLTVHLSIHRIHIGSRMSVLCACLPFTPKQTNESRMSATSPAGFTSEAQA